MTEKKKVPEKIQHILDTEEFNIPAKNLHRETEKCQFYTQPGHAEQARIITTSKLFGYKTVGALYRHALAKHIKWLETLIPHMTDKPLASFTAVTEAMMAIIRQEEYQKQLATVIDRLSGLVGDLMGRGAEGEAKRLVLQINREVKKMQTGYWRDRYVGDIHAKFGYLMDKGQKASLLKLATGEEE